MTCRGNKGILAKVIPLTEQENPRSRDIDRMSVLEAVKLINDEDQKVSQAIGEVLPQIAQTIERIVPRLKKGGRLFYIGTGTSGRLGVLDASEIPPTFGVSGEMIQGIIAGGHKALYQATETSEDDGAAGSEELEKRDLKAGDVVIGIAASGRTPFTVEAVRFARELGCFTVGITSVPDSPITRAAEISIVPETGPEVITGSTRLKAGTAQKMILNMISTVVMIGLGYVRGNRMTNVKPGNAKLRERTLRILKAETGLDEKAARDLLGRAEGDLRVALVMRGANVDQKTAIAALEDSNFVIERAIASLI